MPKVLSINLSFHLCKDKKIKILKEEDLKEEIKPLINQRKMGHLKNTVSLMHTDIITKYEKNYEWLNWDNVFQVYWVYLLVCHIASTISYIIQWKYLSFTCLGFHFCRMCYLLQHWCDILWVRNSKKEASLMENALQVNQEELCQKKQRKLVLHICLPDYAWVRKSSVPIPGFLYIPYCQS